MASPTDASVCGWPEGGGESDGAEHDVKVESS